VAADPVVFLFLWCVSFVVFLLLCFFCWVSFVVFLWCFSFVGFLLLGFFGCVSFVGFLLLGFFVLFLLLGFFVAAIFPPGYDAQHEEEEFHQIQAQEIGWLTKLDPSSGRNYYFNESTGESRWDKPQEMKTTHELMHEEENRRTQR